MYNLLTSGQSAIRKMTFRASQPVVLKAMKEGMGLTQRGADRSLKRVNEALDRLDSRLCDNAYLVGEQFSVADLTAASLLAPVVQPPEAPFQLPGELPDEFKAFCEAFSGRPAIEWVRRMYTQHR
jgi:glutathione S-transferase